MKWIVVPSYGSYFVELFNENGKWVKTYREYDSTFAMVRPRAFSLGDYSKGIPSRIASQLNREYGYE